MRLFSFLILNYKKIIIFFFFLFILSLPFNTKKFILTFDYPLNEFNSVFLYLTDLTLSFFIFICFYFLKKNKILLNVNLLENKFFKFFLTIFLIILFFNLFLVENKILALVFLIRLILLIVLFIFLLILFLNNLINFKYFVFLFLILGIFQSLIGIFQFLKGYSLGLSLLGEPVLNKFMKGVSNYEFLNFSFLRSFGTFPHPNVYAAFLILSLAAFYYYWYLNFLKNDFLKRILLGIGLFLIFLALIYSFSRSAWLAVFLLTFLFLIYGFFRKELRIKAFSLLLIILLFFYLIISKIGWLLNPRIELNKYSPTINYRLIYNEIGIEILKNNFFGIGLANQVIYSIDNFYYQKKSLVERIDFQPIHNLYLLILTELGFLGGIIFFILFFLPFYFIFKNKKLFYDLNYIFLFLIFLVFLFLAFMDHYFYTLQSGRLMFFLVLIFLIILGVLKLNYKNN